MNPLLKLLAQNKGKGRQIKSQEHGEESTLYVYGVIVNEDYWEGGVLAETFVKELRAQTADTIHIRVQSPGGDVFAAVAMSQAILEHQSKIIVHIDGLAASAATFLVMAADETVISEGAEFMIHKAWTIAAGNEFDFKKVADALARVDGTIVDKYMTKVSASREQIEQWMNDETSWFGAEAVEAGFVSAVFKVSDKTKIEKWDLSAYKDDTPSTDAKPLEANINQLAPVLKTDEESPTADGTNLPSNTSLAPELESEKPDLSAHYRQLEVVTLTA